MQKEETVDLSKLEPSSKHLEAKKKAVEDLKEGNAISNEIFEAVIDKEKEKILTEYTDIYEKAIAKIESLETEKLKLKKGKKTYSKNEKGEFVEQEVFDESQVQKMKKVNAQLNNIYKALDETMLKGGPKTWQELAKATRQGG